MKKVLSLLTAVMALHVTAQTTLRLTDVATNATLAPNAILYVKSKALDNVKSHYDVKNISASTQSYKVKRYDMLLHTVGSAKAEAYFCFAGNCYGASTLLSPDALTLTANQAASQVPGSFQMLTADLDEYASVEGLSVVRYTFFNTANTNDSIQITIRYSDSNAPVGIKNETRAVVKADVFPNPSVGGFTTLKVNAAYSFEANVSVINSLGQVVSQKQVQLSPSVNKITIETEGLPAGVYFVKLSGNSETVTRRLIIN